MSGPRPQWLLMAGHVPADGTGGGIVRYTLELARGLVRGGEVDLHLLTDASATRTLPDLVGGGRSVPMPRVPGPLAAAAERGLLTRVLGDRYDVVQGAKHLLPRGVRARGVLTIHDMLVLDRPQDFGRLKRTLLARPYLASLRQADTLLCVSQATRERLSQWAPRAAQDAAVVPLATSPSLLAGAATPVPQLDGRPFALVVGDASARKNLPVVLEAFTDVVRTRPDARLAQVGPPAWGVSSYGPHHAELLASGHLVQLERVEDATLRWCYENAAVSLSPSLVEGFGLPAAEALDLGSPLVTSLDPALVEVSGDRAEHLPADDPAAWAAAVLRHLEAPPRERRRPAVSRTWDDVAAETVQAVLGR